MFIVLRVSLDSGEGIAGICGGGRLGVLFRVGLKVRGSPVDIRNLIKRRSCASMRPRHCLHGCKYLGFA